MPWQSFWLFSLQRLMLLVSLQFMEMSVQLWQRQMPFIWYVVIWDFAVNALAEVLIGYELCVNCSVHFILVSSVV